MKKGIDISTVGGRRVVRGLGYYEPTRVSDLRELVRSSAKRYGSAFGFKFKDKDGRITGKHIRSSREILTAWGQH